MRLECFALSPDPPVLQPARPTRDWMDRITGHHAYRCLPLAIANTYGWEVLSPRAFAVTWNGRDASSDISVEALDGRPWIGHFVTSHFAFGIVTMHVGYLFRTEPGWDLMATGPMNAPKDGIAPLSGVVETDWLPYPFTMNWRFTRPGRVQFAAGEPFCHFFPVPRGEIETVVPEIRALDDDPELAAHHRQWRENREGFMQALAANDPDAQRIGWQRYYFLGRNADGSPAKAGHLAKLRLANPVDHRRRDEDGR